MPLFVDEVICRDFQLARELRGDTSPWHPILGFVEGEEFRSLNRGFLYYSGRGFGVLGRFEQLQHLLSHGSIYRDEVLGWVIYVGHNTELYPFFPEPPADFSIRLDDTRVPAAITDSVRRRLMGGHREEDGTWHDHWQDVVTRIIYCPAAPLALYDWLDRYFDVESIVKHYETPSESAFPEIGTEIRISCFVEILEEKKSYALEPDLLDNERYTRRGAPAVSSDPGA